MRGDRSIDFLNESHQKSDGESENIKTSWTIIHFNLTPQCPESTWRRWESRDPDIKVIFRVHVCYQFFWTIVYLRIHVLSFSCANPKDFGRKSDTNMLTKTRNQLNTTVRFKWRACVHTGVSSGHWHRAINPWANNRDSTAMRLSQPTVAKSELLEATEVFAGCAQRCQRAKQDVDQPSTRRTTLSLTCVQLMQKFYQAWGKQRINIMS